MIAQWRNALEFTVTSFGYLFGDPFDLKVTFFLPFIFNYAFE